MAVVPRSKAAATFLATSSLLALAGAADLPNVLLLIADQFRADALGCAGSTAAFTPNLDWLARSGARFTRQYSSTPTCTPARAALLTGRSPWGHGMLGYGEVARDYRPRSLEMGYAMAAQNYTTAVRGKNHFENGRNDSRVSHGYSDALIYDGLGTGFPNTSASGDFDDYDAFFQDVMPGADPLATGGGDLDWNSWRGAPYLFEEALHPTAWTGRSAVEFIQSHAAAAVADTTGRRPFFLKASFHRPHSPYDPPARLLNATPASSLPPIYAGPPLCNWDADFAGPSKYCGPTRDAWCGAMNPAETNQSRRAYYANIAFVDEWIGRILGALNATGVLDSTFIIFTSDHGDALGDHFHWRKGYPLEATANVPLIVRWHQGFPAVQPRGSVISTAVTELRDILPTVLDVAGGYSPSLPLDGLPITCLLSTAPEAWGAGGCGWREFLDLEHDIVYNATVHWNALTDGAMKFVYHAFDGMEQLFNISSDPHEMTDLAPDAQFAPQLELWRDRMVAQFEAEGRGPHWVVNHTLMVRPGSTTYGPLYPK